jgi:hypothetical protein
MNRLQRRMIGHGAIVTLMALLAGFGLTMSLVGGFEVFPGQILAFEMPGDSRAWARTHSGGLMNGMLVMIVALLMFAMKIDGLLERRLYWMLVGTGYANTVFYWGGLFSQTRAITFGDNQFGETSVAGVIGFAPALVFAVITCIAFIMIMRHAFQDLDQK